MALKEHHTFQVLEETLKLKKNFIVVYFRLRDKKAAIGYTYEDSTEEKPNEEEIEDSESEEDEDIETLDLG